MFGTALRQLMAAAFAWRQQPVGHGAALHAVAADTCGTAAFLAWRNCSQPVHLVEFTLGRTCPSPNKNLIVAWSSLSGVGVCDIRDHCDVYSRRCHEVGDGRTAPLRGGLHGSLNPLPVPTILRSPLVMSSVATREGAPADLLSLPDEILRAVVCFVATVGIPARRLGGCGDTLSVVAQPQLSPTASSLPPAQSTAAVFQMGAAGR